VKRPSGSFRPDQTALRLIACASMLIDHIGDVWFPQAVWMHVLGRPAFPIFAFLLAEGAARTRSPLRYLLRLGVFAAISEAPFDFAFSGGVDWSCQNTIVTLFFGCAMLLSLDRVNGSQKTAVVIAACAAATLARGDYRFVGILLIYAFAVARRAGEGAARPVAFFTAVTACLSILEGLLLRDFSAHLPWAAADLGALLAIPLLARYVPGKRPPPRPVTYAGYLFYPAHLAAIALLAR